MIILLAVLILTFIVYCIQNGRPRNYPPGPSFIPFVGNLLLLKNLGKKIKFQHLVFDHLNLIYHTNVLGLKIGNHLTVVVSSYEHVKEVLTQDVFHGRPDNFFMKLRSMGKRIGITSADGEGWNAQRQFVIKHLRVLGMGKEELSTLIEKELTQFMKTLPNNNVPLKSSLATCIINIIWNMSTGCSFDAHNSRVEKLIDILSIRSKYFDMSGGLLSAFPWLRFLMPKKIGYDMICKLNKELHSLFMKTIMEHYAKHNENKNEDLIDFYITEIKRGKPLFSDEELVAVLLDLFIAGSLTTSTTLDFAIMMMIFRPDIQEKLQKLLDETFDESLPITYSQKSRVCYAEAVLMEVMRFFTIMPIIGPRRTLTSTTIDKFTIPKDTTVLMNLHSVHHDKEYWKDPELFRPERFLDDIGNLINHEYFIPFAAGRRRCPGEILARNCQFTFFTEIVRNFKITLHPDSPEPSLIPLPGIVCSPKLYIPKFTPRTSIVI